MKTAPAMAAPKGADRQFVSAKQCVLAAELLEVQPYMPISTDDRARLKAEIAAEGQVRDPLKGYWSDAGEFCVLAGATRLEISLEMHAEGLWRGPSDKFTNAPLLEVEVARCKPDASSRRRYAIGDNFGRRHLTAEQKRTLALLLLQEDPAQSDRAIGRIVGLDGKTVAAVRSDAESAGLLEPVAARRDARGVLQPGKKKVSAKKKTGVQNSRKKTSAVRMLVEIPASARTGLVAFIRSVGGRHQLQK